MIIIRATDIEDARRQIAYKGKTVDIAINFRSGNDYGRTPVKGAIVEFRRLGKLPLEFENSEEAISYIKSLLIGHDMESDS